MKPEKKVKSGQPLSRIVESIVRSMPQIQSHQKAIIDYCQATADAAIALKERLDNIGQVSISAKASLPPAPPPHVMLDNIVRVMPKIAEQQKAISKYNQDILKAALKYEAALKKIKTGSGAKGRTSKMNSTE